MQLPNIDSDRIFTWKMTNVDNENEKVPAIFKEEIYVEDHSELPAEEYSQETEESSKPRELKRQGTGSSDEYIPEITGVEFDAFLIEKQPEPQIFTEFETKIQPQQNFPKYTANVEVDEQSPREKPVKPEIDFKEEYQFKIPTEGYMHERPYGYDMSVRTEDEVSELPDSEIASLISDRKAEERRDSDVSLSDREYSDKDDENVIISDCEADTEIPFTPKQDIKLDDKSVDKIEVKSDKSEESSDEKSSSTDSSDKSPREPKVPISAPAEQVDLDVSFEESESLGAIPARVFGDQYMQEINRLRDGPFNQGTEQYQEPESEVYKSEKTPSDTDNIEKVKPAIYEKPERNIIASDNASSESSDSDDQDIPEKKKRYILDRDEPGSGDKFGTVPEFYMAGESDERPTEGEYPYGKGLPVPKLRLKRESSDSESDVPGETDESMFDNTTDLETTVDLETSPHKGESPDAVIHISDRDTPGKTTDEDSSTIKEEFITLVDSLEMKPEHMMEVKDYISSEEDEGQKYQPHVRVGEDRSESPEIHSGFAEELELSRITEDEEPQSDDDTSSTTSAESVRQVEIPLRDEVLQTVPEESESAEVSMEIPHEGEISDTSFDVEESFNVEGPLARSTLVGEELTPQEVIMG